MEVPFVPFPSPFSPFAKRPFLAPSPGGVGGSPTQMEGVLIATLFVHSRGENAQAPAAFCPLRSEESHRLHFVVRHPDHHAHQVRSTWSGTEPSLPPKAPACRPRGPLLEALRVFEAITCCPAETYGGGSGSLWNLQSEK